MRNFKDIILEKLKITNTDVLPDIEDFKERLLVALFCHDFPGTDRK